MRTRLFVGALLLAGGLAAQTCPAGFTWTSSGCTMPPALPGPTTTVTGDLNVSGNVNANTGSANPTCIHFTDTSQAHDTVLCAPATGFNGTFNLWTSLGTAGQAAIVDGSGNLGWSNVALLNGTPTITCNPAGANGAGTSPTCNNPTGADEIGQVTITTGTSPSASQNVFTVNFGATHSAAPKGCLMAPNSLATGTSGVYVVSFNSTGFTAKASTTALAASTPMQWSWLCVF
jgi:hypothetical protein